MGIDISGEVRAMVEEIKSDIAGRGYEAANEMRNSAMDVLSRSPSPSAPGQPPGVDNNNFRPSWRPINEPTGSGVDAVIETNIHYAGYLQDGTHNKDGSVKMAPRPYEEPILDDAEPRVAALFDDI